MYDYTNYKNKFHNISQTENWNVHNKIFTILLFGDDR